MAGIAHPRPDHRLQVEGQPVLRPPGDVMQVEPQRPQEVPGPAHVPVLVRRHDHAARRRRLVHQPLEGRVGIDVAVDPVQRLQVAQPAPPLLHVRLHHERRVAIALVPRIALGLLGGDEFPHPGLDTGLAERALELLEHRRVAGDPPRIQQAGAHRHIRLRLAQAIRDRARGVPHLQSQVPQYIEHELDRRLRRRRGIPRRQEQQVDVAERRQHPAAIPPGRRHAQPPHLALRPVQRVLVQRHHQRVGHPAQRMSRVQPLDLARLETLAHHQLHAPQMPAQHRQRRIALQRQPIGPPQRRAQLGQGAFGQGVQVGGFKHRR